MGYGKTNWEKIKRDRKFQQFNRKNPNAKKLEAVQAEGLFSPPVKEMNALDRQLIDNFVAGKSGGAPPVVASKPTPVPEPAPAPSPVPARADDRRFTDKPALD